MRKYFKYILGLVLIVVGIVACDTADQDVSPVISPDNKPVATFTTSSSSTTLTEGDTLVYTVKIDKMLDRALTFSAKVKSGTADDLDFLAEPAVLAPYTTETKLYIIAIADNIPEVGENLELEIGVFGLADKYLLNPSTVNPTMNLTITNYNDPTVLTIAFGWPNHDDDIDVFALYGTTRWGAAASSDNPEILTSIWPDDPNGTYYVGIDPYIVNTPTFDYTISIGRPDQTVEFITGTFDTENLDAYTVDMYGTAPVYRILTIVNLNGVFTITHNN